MCRRRPASTWCSSTATRKSAERGKAHADKLITGQIQRGRAKPEAREALLARIKPSADYGDLKGVDLVDRGGVRGPRR